MTASASQPASPTTIVTSSPEGVLPALYVGIDVSKDSFVVHLRPAGTSRTFQQTPAGLDQVIAWLQPQGVKLMVLEATGGYERKLALALLDAGLPTSVVNPRQSHHAAKVLNRLDKSDHSDAEVLSWMAEHLGPALATRPTKEALELQDLMARRTQLIQMRTAETNRRQQAHHEAARRSIDKIVKTLNGELAKIDAAIAKLIDADDTWRRTAELVQSTIGVAVGTSNMLIAELPELGRLNREKIAALAGLAPRLDQSGTRDGNRHIQGGRSSVRTALYMATLSAIRHNPVIKEYYVHLRAKGKVFKVAITACMRKLLNILNALVKHDTPWRDLLAPTAATT